MRFARPEYLYLLSGELVLVGFYTLVFRHKARALRRFAEPALLDRIATSVSKWRQRLKAGLIILVYSALALALARPQLGTKLSLVRREGMDIIVALDTSLSMQAEDIKPNRLLHAKSELAALIDRLQGDRIGLVVFAGTSFLQCPLTLDYGAAKLFLDLIDTDLLPEQGTAIGSAIRTAMAAFNQQERKHKVLILLTDGEDHGTGPLAASEEAKSKGIRIYPIGIGSLQGEPIPLRNPDGTLREYKKDRQGKVVLSRLDEATLQRLALVTDGKYYRATPLGLELEQVYEDISALEKKTLEAREFAQYEERFQFLVGLALVLLVGEALLTDRRKIKRVWRGRFA